MTAPSKSRLHLELQSKIHDTVREIKQERRAKKDLSERTSGVESRIAQLEKAAPSLREAQDSYYCHQPHPNSYGLSSEHLNNNNNTNQQQQYERSQLSSSESMRSRSMLYNAENPEARAVSRESYRLNSASRERSKGYLPTGPIATSSLTTMMSSSRGRHGSKSTTSPRNSLMTNGRRGTGRNENPYNTTLSDREGLPVGSANKNNADNSRFLENASSVEMSDSNDKSKQNLFYESRRQMAASHDFPTISTFFSYPPRDEHGYLVPTGRSSKRTAYATTHSGEHIIGRSESQVNRERMKKAEKLYLDKEKDAIARARAERAKDKKAQTSLVLGAEGSGSDELYPERLAPKPTVLYTPRDSRPPGHSKTSELAVHQMPPAGKNLLQTFESGDHQFKSSKRTLFYTDYTGKRIMIDACDMPKVHGFVLTGF